MAAKRKSRKKSTSVPARRRSAPRAGKTPARRRTKRRSGMLSAGTNYSAIAMQMGLALAGGVAGKIARNAMPDTLAPEIKALGVSVVGVLVAIGTKQPMIGAGMIGSAGAYIGSVYGEKNGIKLLSDQYGTGYNRLSETVQVYTDEQGNPLRRVGDAFYYGSGQLAPFTPGDFVTIQA